MTATLVPTGDTWTIGAPRLLAGLAQDRSLDLGAHLATHGPLPAIDRARLIGLVDAIALAGRGGAGFPFGAKLRALAGPPREVIVNGSESEPASRKDRTLLRRTPHLALDGAVAVAAALGGRHVTIAVHDPAAAETLRRAIAERRDPLRIRVELVAGGFVGGEARAVRRAVRGGPARPPGRRVHLTSQATLLANAETFAQVAIALRLGPVRFRDTGTSAEPGTTLLTVGGAVTRPGVVEAPLGTPLGIVLSAAGAAPQPRAVIIGGYHGSWHPPMPGLRLSHADGRLGAGVVLVLDGNTCALGELARVAAWLAAQSAGQCGPCRFGLPALADDVAALLVGLPAPAALRHAQAVTGRGACRHPDGAARFVTSALAVLSDEIERHRLGGCGRPVLGQLAVPA
jgi:NADH:ubiquinone oxidoreductase subunit F (NADH-binding)